MMTRRELLAALAITGVSPISTLGGYGIMKEMEDIKVLFVAGFGPIVSHTAISRRLYKDALDIPFKEEKTATSTLTLCKGAKSLLSGHSLRRRSLVLATIPGPARSLRLKLGLSLMWTALRRQQRSLSREAIECSSGTEKNRGARL
jgi:hypothetical protein